MSGNYERLIGSRAVEARPDDVPEVCDECGEPTRDFRILLDADGHKVAGAWGCGCTKEIGAIMRQAVGGK